MKVWYLYDDAKIKKLFEMIDNQNEKQQSRRSFRIYSLFNSLYFVYPKAFYRKRTEEMI